MKYKIGMKTSAASRTVMKVLLSAGGCPCWLVWAGTEDGGCLRQLQFKTVFGQNCIEVTDDKEPGRHSFFYYHRSGYLKAREGL